MKFNELSQSKPRHHMNLNNLDIALHDLGMLSTITEARHEYLCESRSKSGMKRFSKRYVGYWVKRAPNKNRLCPYVLPVRHRTKSENSDAVNSDASDETRDFKNILLEPSTSAFTSDVFDTKYPTKRCQSLENLNLTVEPQPASETSPDMDCVSTQIQKLQVHE